MKRLVSFFKPTPFNIGIIVIILSLMIWYSFHDSKPDLFTVLDNRIFDQMFKFRGPVKTTGRIIIIDIDEKSLKKYGQWPWPRDQVALLMKNINDAKALVTGFDIVFAERDRTTLAVSLNRYKSYFKTEQQDEIIHDLIQNESIDHDMILGDEIAQGNVVAGYSFITKNDGLKNQEEVPFPSINIGILPKEVDYTDLMLKTAYRSVINIPELGTAVSEGFFTIFPDPSGTVRKTALFMAMDDIPYPSLSLEMYRIGEKQDKVILQASAISRDDKKRLIGIHIGPDYIPTDFESQVTVNYRGPVYSFDYLSASDIMENKQTDKLRGKYVLIGTSATGLSDLVATPYSPTFPGVEVHATIIDNLLQNDPMAHEKYTEIGLTYVVIMASGLLITSALVYLSPLTGSFFAFSLIGLIIIEDYFLYFLNNQLVGVSYVLVTLIFLFLVVTVFNYFYEGRQKQYIRKAFSHYLAPSVINELIKDPDFLKLRVEKKIVTIFFSDIRSFTNLSERIGENKLGSFMNQYFSVVSKVIMKHKGMVDKYIGDAVMAVWGTPVDDPGHAINAIKAAIEIKDRLSEFNKKWEHLDIKTETGIGINTGSVVVGNFGSTDRFDYTVLGDNVNLASRLEGLNKSYKTDMIISEYTKDMAGEQLYCRYLDTVRVKGKTKPVQIFQPLCMGTPDSKLKLENESFNKAVKLYLKKEFNQAMVLFKTLFSDTNDYLYQLYAERCEEFIEYPPEGDWDGVFTHKTK